MALSLTELIDNFSCLSDWEDKYRYLLELGTKMPPMSAEEHTPENKVSGCMSQVWMSAHKMNNRYFFTFDSDAHIVKGLESILWNLVDGKTADEIRTLPLKEIFTKLDLEENISPNRRNGFRSMIDRIYKTINLQ